MKITILAIGSRGDVQPLIALGVKLQQSGHQIKFATHANFEPFIRSQGLDFALMESNPQSVLESPAGKEALQGNVIQSFRKLARAFEPIMAQVARECWAASQGSEAIIYSGGTVYFGTPIARALGVPEIGVFVVPIYTPTRDCASPYLMPYSLGGPINYLSYLLSNFSVWQMFGPSINQWRKEQLNLPPVGVNYLNNWHKEGVLTLYGFSSQVLPVKNLGPTAHITGYWALEEDKNWQPSAELQAFLAAGPPPIYVGFGSMYIPNPQEKGRAILAALQETGQRGIISRGWGGLGDMALPANVMAVENVPHSWLFPQMAAVVHHGGAGTTAAGLRAGVPGIIVPFLADQPFWGWQLARLGVGTKPLPRQKFTAAKLAENIRMVLNNPTMQASARQLGARLRQEDGTGQAVSLINQYLRGT